MRCWARAAGRVMLVLVLLLLAWQALAEAVEQSWTLALSDVLSRPAPPRSVSLGQGLELRLYADTRPHIGKIAGLQKGLVLAYRGRELVEEGYGFGCPIIEVDGKAYCSRQADTSLLSEGDRVRLVKRFVMDTLDTPARPLRPKYRPTPALGVVECRYDVMPDLGINIEVDLSGLNHAWDRAYLMNEQGARAFPGYRDEHGVHWVADQVGPWQMTDAGWVEFRSTDGRRAFRVFPTRPATVYLGRERYLQYNWRGAYYLSWAGVDIEIGSTQAQYRYSIRLTSE